MGVKLKVELFFFNLKTGRGFGTPHAPLARVWLVSGRHEEDSREYRGRASPYLLVGACQGILI